MPQYRVTDPDGKTSILTRPSPNATLALWKRYTDEYRDAMHGCGKILPGMDLPRGWLLHSLCETPASAEKAMDGSRYAKVTRRRIRRLEFTINPVVRL